MAEGRGEWGLLNRHHFSFASWSFGNWLHHDVNIVNINELYILNSYEGKFYVLCILPQIKNKREEKKDRKSTV